MNFLKQQFLKSLFNPDGSYNLLILFSYAVSLTMMIVAIIGLVRV